MKKGQIVYFNLDSYIETDVTVLNQISNEYDLTWIPLRFQSFKQFSKKEILDYAQRNSIKIYYFEYSCRQRSLSFFFLILRIVLLIKSLNPDIIYSSTRTLYWSILSACFLNKRKRVSAFHDVQYHSSAPHRRINIISDWFLRKFSSYYSVFSKNQQKAFFKQYKILPNLTGLSIKDFGVSNKKCPPIEKCVLLLFFGSINGYKGLDLLIQAIENLDGNEKSRIRLSIYGKGDFWNVCKKYIKTESLYDLNIRFIDNSEIPDLMSTHHFLVLPYRDATQSGPVAIAANYRLPIIAPDINSFTDIYTPESAIFYPQGNTLLGLHRCLKLSSEDYNKMKNACNSIYEQFTPKNVAKRYVDFFNNIIAENKKI